MASTRAQLLAGLTKQAHWLINAVFEDVDDELANRPAPGNANPLGTAYAHVVFSEDAAVNVIFNGGAPLLATTFAGKTGVDKPMPMPGMVEGDMGEWFHTAKVDLSKLRPYAAAVFEGTEQFIEGADDATLDRMLDLSFAEMGERSLVEIYGMFVLQHCDNFSGELSAIKGAFGLKGYPF